MKVWRVMGRFEGLRRGIGFRMDGVMKNQTFGMVD
jgi:hypothetical protein